MPLKSKAQQRWMFANHPAMAKRWAEHTPDIKSLPEHVDKKGEYRDQMIVLVKTAMVDQYVAGKTKPGRGLAKIARLLGKGHSLVKAAAAVVGEKNAIKVARFLVRKLHQKLAAEHKKADMGQGLDQMLAMFGGGHQQQPAPPQYDQQLHQLLQSLQQQFGGGQQQNPMQQMMDPNTYGGPTNIGAMLGLAGGAGGLYGASQRPGAPVRGAIPGIGAGLGAGAGAMAGSSLGQSGGQALGQMLGMQNQGPMGMLGALAGGGLGALGGGAMGWGAGQGLNALTGDSQGQIEPSMML